MWTLRVAVAVGGIGVDANLRILQVCVVFLDTLTPEFELYVRLRERRQWDNDLPEFVLVSLLFDFFLVERQLDLSSVTARLRGCSCVVLSGLDIGLISQ
ncbi:hypothetical protein Taro_044656 [Colocasia esculenta]|uniref:Uncharacterized protein n=1 Tax=Colocasia esculenta TaxID=4460 RepID=A0A843WUK3_COLES|nr:hypothetical protein [Colocasia esculenta]